MQCIMQSGLCMKTAIVVKNPPIFYSLCVGLLHDETH